MNKQNIIRGFLAASMLALTVSGARGQAVPASDTTVFAAPGVMFNNSAITNTAAVSTSAGDMLYKTPASNLSNTFPGMLNGLTVIQGSGEAGNDDAALLIRGVGSFSTNGWNTAKIFVDGFEVNRNYMNSLSPSEIESVSILKDGAALTLFGDRGANGIIWIVTKRGKNGPATITAHMRGGVQMPTKVAKSLDSYDYAYLYNIANSNDRGEWTPAYSNTQLQSYQDGTGVNVDWYDEVMKDAGTYIDGDVNFNGGNENARYNVVFGYVNQQGLFDVKNDRDASSNLQYAKYNLRANLDFNIYKIFEAKVDIGGKLMDRKTPNYSIGSLMSNIATYPANIYNVYDDTDQTRYSGTTTYPNNPVGSIKGLGYQFVHNRILQGNFSLKEKLDFITPGLYMLEAFSFYSYTSSGQVKSKDYARYKDGEVQGTNKDEPMTAGGWGSYSMEDWKQGVIQLGYDLDCGPHLINAAAGVHISSFKGNGYASYKYNYLNYRGRINYSFDDRFTAEVGLSIFGNDAYAPDQRWSVYPAVSGAWIISNEDFLKGSRNVNFLKLRASFGISGSSDSNATSNITGFSSANGRFLYKQYYTTSYNYGFYTGATSGSWQTPLLPMFMANPDAHAERSYKYDVGVDASLFGKKLTLSADVYLDNRKDILVYDHSLMSYYGQNNLVTNSGAMTNKGFELMAIYSNKIGDWSYTLNGMLAYNHNTVDNQGEVPTKYAYNAYTGRPLGTYIGLEANGFYSTDDFNGSALKSGLPIPAYGDVQPGDIKYKDLDGNGIVDDDDVTKIGNSTFPEWTYSFGGTVRYKKFDLGLMLQGVAKVSYSLLDDDMWNQSVPFIGNRTVYERAANAWAYYPAQGIDTRDSATYPRLTTQENTNNYRSSSFWVKDGSYFKIRSIELGYTFNLENTGASNMRLYATATNPFAFAKSLKDYDMDPESRGICYPALKSFTLGISLSF